MTMRGRTDFNYEINLRLRVNIPYEDGMDKALGAKIAVSKVMDAMSQAKLDDVAEVTSYNVG